MGGPLLNPDKIYNFLTGASDKDINLALKGCTLRQRRVLDSYLARVPQGVLLINGTAGCGKTTVAQRIMFLQMLAGKRFF